MSGCICVDSVCIYFGFVHLLLLLMFPNCTSVLYRSVWLLCVCLFVCCFLVVFFFVSSYSCIFHLYSILLLVGFHLTFRVRSNQCKYIQIHFVWLKNGNPIIIINYCVDHKQYELARLGAWCTFELCACQANRAKNRAKYRANQSTVSQQQHSADWMNGPNNIEQWNRISCYYWKSKQRCHLTNNNNTRWEDDDNEK